MHVSGYPQLPAHDPERGYDGDAPGAPWWLTEALDHEERAGLSVPAPILAGTAHTDVAIVGGGYTGLWTALALLDREPTTRVTVVEQAICGYGASGRNGGLVAGY